MYHSTFLEGGHDRAASSELSAPQSQVGQDEGEKARALVKTKERMKDQTKSHATEQTNYGRLQQPGTLDYRMD